MKIPCSNVKSQYKYSNQGSQVVAPLASNIPGGIIVDGTTWTMSNTDQAGWPINWARDLAANDVIGVLTDTGWQVATVSTIVRGATQTVFTVVQGGAAPPAFGVLYDGQPTGVWKVTAAGLPCGPETVTDDAPVITDRGGEKLPPPVQQEELLSV